MPNLNAAVGCAQLEQLSGFVSRKRALARCYREAFADVPGVEFFTEPGFAQSNYWLCVLLLEQADVETRDSLLGHLHEAGIMARTVWSPLHHMPMYADCPRMDLSVSEDLAARIINIPSSPHLMDQEGR